MGAQYTKDIQQHVDYVNLMAFDFTGAWPSSKIEHHSNYETFLQAVKHTLDKGFDPQKILIGFPAYGIEFIGNKKKEIKHVSYRDIVDMVGQSLPALARGKFKNIYFENTALFEKKARYVSQNGLAGIFIFDIASDHPSPEFSLLESSRKHIKPLQSGKK